MGVRPFAVLAERETDLQRSMAFRTLADAEQRHADLWAGRIRALGGSPLTYDGPRTGEADNLANRIGGINMALRRLELDETHDIAKYAKQTEDIADQQSIVILQPVQTGKIFVGVKWSDGDTLCAVLHDGPTSN